MKYRKLGRSNIDISVIGLGTMTWGSQNSEAEAHEQMDYALSRGVNFFDAAEMYPVPPQADTQGRTEECIGTWLKKSGKRNQVTIASKVTGPADYDWIRGGPRLSKEQIFAACETSLKRLQTDVIDLYQVHWPERAANFFGKLGYEHSLDTDGIAIEETYAALNELVKQGKVRHLGISNETPWGLSEYLRLEREHNWPRIHSIQNPYSLLNRTFEVGLAEFSHRADVGLLAYSPLGFGVLSGKYLDGAQPKNARLTLFSRFQRYSTDVAKFATRDYVKLAKDNGLDPAQMALAWVNSRPFVSSNLIGATTMAQLKSNIDSIELELSDAVIKGIEHIHSRASNPCP